jgi:hypothetical protein
MQFFAAKGLATPIADAWKTISGTFPSAVQDLSKGTDCRRPARPRPAQRLVPGRRGCIHRNGTRLIQWTLRDRHQPAVRTPRGLTTNAALPSVARMSAP